MLVNTIWMTTKSIFKFQLDGQVTDREYNETLERLLDQIGKKYDAAYDRLMERIEKEYDEAYKKLMVNPKLSERALDAAIEKLDAWREREEELAEERLDAQREREEELAEEQLDARRECEEEEAEENARLEAEEEDLMGRMDDFYVPKVPAFFSHREAKSDAGSTSVSGIVDYETYSELDPNDCDPEAVDGGPEAEDEYFETGEDPDDYDFDDD